LDNTIFWDKLTDVSEELVASPSRGEKQATQQAGIAACFLTGFLIGLFLEFDHGGGISLRNVWIFLATPVPFIKPGFRLHVL
jgi:hypothetical protein